MSGRSSCRGIPVTRSTSKTRSTGTRGHWLTADRVTPIFSARRVTPPAALTARSFGLGVAFLAMVSIANQSDAALSSDTGVALSAPVQQIWPMPRKTTGGATLGARITQAREGAGLSQTALGKSLGITRSAVSQWESGDTEPTPEKLRGIAMETGVNYDWLATGRGAASADIRSEDVAASLDKKPRRMVRVKGYVGAGGLAHYYAVDPGDLGEIEGGGIATDQTVALVIIGGSLGSFFDRWHVLYDDVRSPVTDDLIGELCVVGLADDRVLVKKIQRNGRGFDLHSNAESEAPIRNVKIDWAAKVTDLRRG